MKYKAISVNKIPNVIQIAFIHLFSFCNFSKNKNYSQSMPIGQKEFQSARRIELPNMKLRIKS